MTRRHPLSLGLALLPLVALLSAAQPAAAQTPFFSYSVKFVCGSQPDNTPEPIPGEPVVKPGNYATEINIHNIQFAPLQIFKSVLVLVENGQPIGREPNFQGPRGNVVVPMGPNTAMMDDCNQIWRMVFPMNPPPSPMPLFIGHFQILSTADLDIDAVYTTQANRNAANQEFHSAPSIDVERVLAKRITIPAAAATAAIRKLR